MSCSNSSIFLSKSGAFVSVDQDERDANQLLFVFSNYIKTLKTYHYMCVKMFS